MFKADDKGSDCANSTPDRASATAASDGMSIGILAKVVWWQEEFARQCLRLDEFFRRVRLVFSTLCRSDGSC
jgi:hypothetical protein